jgi:MtN3 and saliva related transmembrane protein
MYIVFVGGVCLWMVYGLLITSLPIMLWNFCTLLLAGTILVMKLRFG